MYNSNKYVIKTNRYNYFNLLRNDVCEKVFKGLQLIILEKNIWKKNYIYVKFIF